MIIKTKNLDLVACTPEILKSAIEADDLLSEKLSVNVQNDWTEFGFEALKFAHDKLNESETQKNWWTYLPIFRIENKLIGSGGYCGKPTEDGSVEIGYEICTGYRNRGLATEMAEGLIKNAFTDARVKSIIAHTLGLYNASTKVLQKCGFKKVAEINDPNDGILWKWRLD
jgi:ribosomal-protein-alanine N-acetyltransferase